MQIQAKTKRVVVNLKQNNKQIQSKHDKKQTVLMKLVQYLLRLDC